jgi:hypothetical protein
MKEQIEEAIAKALRRESKLTPEAMEPGGFTSPEIRNLMNNLGAISKNYMELGILRGALSVATAFDNDHLKITLCDNWSEFNESDGREDFFRNHAKFMPSAKVLEQDCFTIKNEQVPPNVDLYLYDAGHSREAQAKALTYFDEFVANQFIFCVDDYDWDDVKRGTQQGLKICGYEILAQWELTGTQWWNGYSVFLLKK